MVLEGKGEGGGLVQGQGEGAAGKKVIEGVR